MKKMNGPSPYLLSPLLSFSLSLVSLTLLTATPNMGVNTGTESSFNQSTAGLPNDWAAKIRQGTSEIERVTEHKGTLLTLRSHQWNTAFDQKVQVVVDHNPHGLGKENVAKWLKPRVVMSEGLKNQVSDISVIGTTSDRRFAGENTGCGWKSMPLVGASQFITKEPKSNGSPI